VTQISEPSIVALIPARAGSTRCPGKNTRLLAGRPLVSYTVVAAKESGIFREIYLCTDDRELMQRAYGVGILGRAPVPDDQPDIVWVKDALERIPNMLEAFAILRPTSPFRTAETIRKTWDTFKTSSYDSMRAVEPAKQHPGKMWFLDKSVYGGQLIPLLGERINETPWHSFPTQYLPDVYVQNASLEMAWTRVVHDTHTISGTKIGPILMPGHEGFDINTEDDWQEAVHLMNHQPLEYLG